MKKGIALVLTLALLLSMTLLFPMRHSEATSLVSATKSSSDPSSEEVVKEVFGALNALDSLHLDMDITVELNVVVSYSGQKMSVPMNILMHVDMAEQKEPLLLGGQMNLEMNAMGSAQKQDILFYTVKEDGVITSYSSSDNGVSWTAKQADAPSIDPLEISAVLVSSSKDFSAAGKELVDGTETTVYAGKLSTSFLQQLMEEAGGSTEAMSDLTGGGLTASDLGGLGDIDVVMYVDPETHLPLRYSMDMSGMMKDLMKLALASAEGMDGYEVDVEIGVAKAECRLSDFNSIAPIEIPEAAKGSAVAGPGVAAAGALLFKESSDEPAPMVQTQIQETVLADMDAVRIVAKSISYPAYSYESVKLDLAIENRTDKQLIVTNDLLVVNGFDMMGSMYEEVDPGATIEATLLLDDDVLRWAEITTIADLAVSFSVSSSDYSMMLDTPRTHLRTDAPEGFVQAVDEDGVCVWDDHGIKIIARHLEPCYGSSAELVLLIENRTSSYVYLATDTVKINGIAVDLFGNEMLSSNSYAISSLLIDEDALTAQNIQSIDSISLQFEITVHDQAGTELKTDLVEIPVVY